jgi:hypothetical protein
MKKSLFLPSWQNAVNNTLVDSIIKHLESDDSVVLKDFNFLDYTKGITFNDELRENGMYIFRFSDGKYYVGKASSCTMLERIAKHIDGRNWGGFNAVLKGLGQKEVNQDYHIKNQQEFLKAKVVLIPISKPILLQNSIIKTDEKPIHRLENDLIHAFKLKLGRENLRNGKYPKGFSGDFNLLQTTI